MNPFATLKHALRLPLLFLLAGLVPLPAQTALDKGVICAGVTKSTGGTHRAYLVLEPTDLALTMARQVAIYRKAGAATSTSLFARKTVLEPVTDPLLITSLLPLAASLGENLPALEGMMSDLTGIPIGTGTTGEKLATFISDSLPDPDKRKQLLVLARTHPAIGFAAGLAWAETLPSATAFTYEFRDFDSASSTDRGVMGRVTLNPAAPVIIPAPGKPVEVVDTSAKSNLNVSLRWYVPDTIQDLAPLLNGFDVYRVPALAASARGWDTTPPANAGTLLTEPTARRVNNSGIMPSKLYVSDPAAADLVADPTTIYLIDDNGRFQPGGVPFTDGDTFYYFAAARDLLGQPGGCSAGKKITICDRFPPPVPVQLAVRSVTHFNSTTKKDVQRFELEWKMPALPAGETVSAFLVYRWTSAAQAARPSHLDEVQLKPDENLVAMLPGTQMNFVDDGLTATPAWANWAGGNDNGASYIPPGLPSDAGKTYFYTIRAVDGSTCRNVSGNSSPIWGVLRDRSGPAGTVGTVLTPCRQLTLTWNDYTQITETGLSAELGHLRLVCTSTVARGLAWAEWEYGYRAPGQNQFSWTSLGRAHFSKNSAGNLRAELDRNVSGYYGLVQKFRCRVGTTAGIVSAFVESPLDPPSPIVDRRIRALWTADFGKSFLLPVAQCGGKHIVLDPDTGVLLDPCGTFNPTPDSTEFKVYRTVDGGPQTLVDAGFYTTSAPVVWKDENPPVTLSGVCYYLQLFDKNSNAGPLVPQDCIECGEASLLPVPMLEDLASAGLPGSGQMRVRWFCNTAGVERFEIWVARKGGTAPVNGAGLSTDLAGHPNMLTDVSGAEGLDFSVFETAVARHVSASGTPEFEYLLPVSAKDVYTVMVRAVGKGAYDSRMTGTFSNLENFTWSLRTLPLGNAVPWPARDLPPQAEFHPGISAVHLNISRLAPWRANAVRIGEYADPQHDPSSTTILINDNSPTDPRGGRISTLRDAETYLYCNDEVAKAEENAVDKLGYEGCIFPVVLYRVQVPSLKFPIVPGDIVQCGPMMEQIAQSESGGKTLVTDPFILPMHMNDTGLARTLTGSDHDIMLLDRQPVIKGAKYKYLLVRFARNKEIDRVIVTNEVFVP
jgi:hypothetical protein